MLAENIGAQSGGMIHIHLNIRPKGRINKKISTEYT